MEIKYFTEKEIKKLFRTIKNSDDDFALRNFCIFKVAFRCGLRASEIGLIKVSDYNKQKGELYCRRLKGSQNNTLRLDKETINSLNKYIRFYNKKDDDFLFTSKFKKPISRKTLDVLVKKYCKEAKLNDNSKWHFHTLKHSCAVFLAEQGLDIKELQFWLGHKNVNNTQIYFQFTTSQQESMYKKLESS